MLSKTSDSTFKLAAPRALAFPGDVIHFPTFTDYDGSLAPGAIVFASALNFKADGTFPPAAEDTTSWSKPGSQRKRQAESDLCYAVAIHYSQCVCAIIKESNQLGGLVPGINPLSSNTRSRIAFTLAATELGGGNGPGDDSNEVFYLPQSLGNHRLSSGSIILYRRKQHGSDCERESDRKPDSDSNTQSRSARGFGAWRVEHSQIDGAPREF